MAARVVKGMPAVALDKETFAERFRLRFYDPDAGAAEDEVSCSWPPVRLRGVQAFTRRRKR